MKRDATNVANRQQRLSLQPRACRRGMLERSRRERSRSANSSSGTTSRGNASRVGSSSRRRRNSTGAVSHLTSRSDSRRAEYTRHQSPRRCGEHRGTRASLRAGRPSHDTATSMEWRLRDIGTRAGLRAWRMSDDHTAASMEWWLRDSGSRGPARYSPWCACIGQSRAYRGCPKAVQRNAVHRSAAHQRPSHSGRAKHPRRWTAEGRRVLRTAPSRRGLPPDQRLERHARGPRNRLRHPPRGRCRSRRRGLRRLLRVVVHVRFCRLRI